MVSSVNRFSLTMRAFGIGLQVMFKRRKKMDPTTFKGAVATGTSVSAAIAATLFTFGLWTPVIFQKAPITLELMNGTLGLISLWVTVVFARRAMAKKGSAQ